MVYSPVFERITLSYKLGYAASVNIIYKEMPLLMTNLFLMSVTKRTESFLVLVGRCGFPTEKTLQILNKKVIDMSLTDKFNDLHQSGESPVCLFPTRKVCCDFKMEMLISLTSKLQELVCTDKVDQTISIYCGHLNCIQ